MRGFRIGDRVELIPGEVNRQWATAVGWLGCMDPGATLLLVGMDTIEAISRRGDQMVCVWWMETNWLVQVYPRRLRRVPDE